MTPIVTALEYNQQSHGPGFNPYITDTLHSLQQMYLELCKKNNFDKSKLGRDPEKLIKTAMLGWIPFTMESPFLKGTTLLAYNYKIQVANIIKTLVHPSQIPSWSSMSTAPVYIFKLPENKGIAGATFDIDAGRQIASYKRDPTAVKDGDDIIKEYDLQIPILKILFEEYITPYNKQHIDWVVMNATAANVEAIHNYITEGIKSKDELLPPRQKAFTAFHNIFKKL